MESHRDIMKETIKTSADRGIERSGSVSIDGLGSSGVDLFAKNIHKTPIEEVDSAGLSDDESSIDADQNVKQAEVN